MKNGPDLHLCAVKFSVNEATKMAYVLENEVSPTRPSEFTIFKLNPTLFLFVYS